MDQMVAGGARASRPAAFIRRHFDRFRSDALYWNSSFLILNTLTLTGTGVLFWLLAAAKATPMEVGVATAFFSAATLISMASKLGFDTALLKAIPAAAGDRGRLVNVALTASAVLSIVLGAAFTLGASVWTPGLASLLGHPIIASGFIALTLMMTVGGIVDAALVGTSNASRMFAKNAMYAVGRIAALVPFVVLFGGIGIVWALLAALAGSMLVAGIAFRRTFPAYQPRPSWEPSLARRLVRGASANYLVALLFAVPLTIGSLIVLQRFGSASTAEFYLLWTFGSLAMVVPNAIGQVSLVEIVRRNDVGVAARLWPLVLSLFAGLAALAAGLVIAPFFGSDYDALGLWGLLPFAVAALPGYVLQVRLSQFRATRQDSALLASASLTVAVFVACLAFAPIAVDQTGIAWLASVTAGMALALTLRISPRGVEH